MNTVERNTERLVSDPKRVMRTILFCFALVSAALIQPVKGTTISLGFEFEAVKDDHPLGVEVGIPMKYGAPPPEDVIGHIIFVSHSVGKATRDASDPDIFHDPLYGDPFPGSFTDAILSGARIYVGLAGYIDKEIPLDFLPFYYPYDLIISPYLNDIEISHYELELTLAEETQVEDSFLFHVKYEGTFRIVGERKPVPDSGKTLVLLGLGSFGLMARSSPIRRKQIPHLREII